MDLQDKQILDLLMENSRLTNKEIGERIHMTGQAVGNRIIRLMEEGTLEKFTIKVHYETKQFIYLYIIYIWTPINLQHLKQPSMHSLT